MITRISIHRFALAALAVIALAPSRARADGDEIFDPATKKAVLHYQDRLLGHETGVYEGEGWTFFHVRVPFDKSIKGRAAAQKAARSAHDSLVLGWAIDRALEKGAPAEVAALSPGAARVRALVRAEVPAWEFESIEVPPLALQQLADQAEGAFFVVASGGPTEKLLKGVPSDIGSPWPSARWAAAAKDAVRLRYRADPAAFWTAAGALDLSVVRQNYTTGAFPNAENEDFPAALSAFVAKNAFPEISGAAPTGAVEEAKTFASALSRYVSESEEGRRFRDRALALQRPLPLERTLFDEPVFSFETNIVATVTTNWIEQAQTISTRTVRNLVDGKTLRGATPLGGAVYVERASTPLFTVTTNETVTIRRHTEVRAQAVRVSETGRPQFERLFLSAGTLANSPAPQTERGAAAVFLFSKKGATATQREASLLDALGENPGDKSLWNYLGRIFQAREDWLGAAICFRNALQIDPEFDFALTNLADCHKALGNMNLAVGTAVLARGLATNEWCEKRAAAILEAPRDPFGNNQ